jgi:Flp pilus assembly protein TadB
VSKERAQRRAERELRAQALSEEQLAARSRAKARVDRRRRWERVLRRRGRRPVSARTKERRAVIGSVLLVVLLLTYLMSRSIALVIGVGLIAAIATPAIVTVLSDRNR